MNQRELVNGIMLAIKTGGVLPVLPRLVLGDQRVGHKSPIAPGIRRGRIGSSVRTPGVDGRKRPLTDEHRAKLREAHRGSPGRPQTSETKAKISAARRAQYVPVMAECHPDERAWGHGKCRRCYMRDWMRERRHVKAER